MGIEFSEQTDALAKLLSRRAQRLATAESCTGGWIAKACTDRPGSSDWFDCGFVTYSNEAKQEHLGVSSDTIQRYGAVSRQTVVEMVCGVLARSRADWGVAVSGIAGPGGGTRDKPVGTVWFAWAGPGEWVCTHTMCFEGDRDAVRQAAVLTALQVLVDRLNQPG